MCRNIGVFVPATLLLAVACSHEQKPPTTTSASVLTEPRPKLPAMSRASSPQPPSTLPVLATRVSKGSSIYFDFDSAVLREEARPALQMVATSLKNGGREQLRIEGNCDQLGTVEYNLALGEHRAFAAKDYLVSLGVPRDRIATISYGSEHPKYPGLDESDRQKNRRDDFIVARAEGSRDLSTASSAPNARGHQGRRPSPTRLSN